jgi:hypothetical protein
MEAAMNEIAKVANRLAWLALVLAGISATAGLVVPGLYHDSDGWIRQARAADLVTLFAVVPVLTISLWRIRAGSGTARLTALAALGYLVYNYGIFGFSVAINAMTPVHIAVLGLSVWSLVLSVVDLTRDPLRSHVGGRLPRRASGLFLLSVAALFALMWLGQIAQAISSGVLPEALASLGLSTNPVYTLDLAFALPFLALTGVLLLRRSRASAELAVAAMTWVALMGAGVFAIFVFDGLAGAVVPWAVATVIGLITGVAVAFTTLGLLPERRETGISVATA